MKFHVYIAKAGAQTVYVGATSNLDQRAAIHASTTPWWHTVTHVEAIPVATEAEAAETERRLIAEHLPVFNKDGVTRRYARYTYTPGRPRSVTPSAATLLLTYAQAAHALSVSRATLYRMIRRGTLTPVRLPLGGPRLHRADVAALADPAKSA